MLSFGGTLEGGNRGSNRTVRDRCRGGGGSDGGNEMQCLHN